MFNKKPKEVKLIDSNFTLGLDLSDDIRSIRDSLKCLNTFRKAVEEHDSILHAMLYTGAGLRISGGGVDRLHLNGIELETDYRDEELRSLKKMVKCLIISKGGSTDTKYTQEKNLTTAEKAYYKANGFVLVDIK